MPMPICFLSDLGHTPEHVGVAHGVIGRIDPSLTVIDITHEIPSGNVRAGALALLRTVQYLPEGVILGCVNPLGSRLIAARTPAGIFVGPDNGLLAPAVAMVGGADKIVSIESDEFRIPSSGETLVLRDVLAPAAGALASGQAVIDDLGPVRTPESVTPLILPLVDHTESGVVGEILWVDGDGTAQSNVSPADLNMIDVAEGDEVVVRVGAIEHRITWVDDRRSVGGGDGYLFTDSFGQIAIGVTGGSAAEYYALEERIAVTFRRAERGIPISVAPRRADG